MQEVSIVYTCRPGKDMATNTGGFETMVLGKMVSSTTCLDTLKHKISLSIFCPFCFYSYIFSIFFLHSLNFYTTLKCWIKCFHFFIPIFLCCTLAMSNNRFIYANHNLLNCESQWSPFTSTLVSIDVSDKTPKLTAIL